VIDNPQLTRWKTLANDSIIATFGYDSRETKLAEALEQAVEALDEMSNDCETCAYCDDHGNKDGQGVIVDVDEILRIHGELKKQVAAFKDLHVELALQIEETEDSVNELEAEVVL
jgi:hypothetical protein